MFIDKNGKRINPHATIEVDGVSYHGNIIRFPEAMGAIGMREIAEPSEPEDYDQEFWFRQEIDEAPYVIYTKKSEEQIAAIKKARLQAQIDAIEVETKTSRQVREFLLSQPNASAQSWYAGVKSAEDRVSAIRDKIAEGTPKTKAQKIADVMAEYQANRSQLQSQILVALLVDGEGEAEALAEIRSEAAKAKTDYLAKIAAIKKGN